MRITHSASDHTQAAEHSSRKRRMRSGATGSVPALPTATLTAQPAAGGVGHDGRGEMPCRETGTTPSAEQGAGHRAPAAGRR